MRESTQSHIALSLRLNGAVSGAVLIKALNEAKSITRFHGYFELIWETHYLEEKACQRARILRTQKKDGSTRYTYGFFLTASYKLCRPLVIDPKEQYEYVYLVIDSWGVNFQQHKDEEGFLKGCLEHAKNLRTAIQTALEKTAR